MNVEDVLGHYGSSYNFNKITKMSINNIRNWKRLGYIPAASQIKLELMTNSILKSDFSHTVKNAD